MAEAGVGTVSDSLQLVGPVSEIMKILEEDCPEVRYIVEKAHDLVPTSKRQIWDFQAAALFLLANRVGTPGSHFLEIGTAFGFSATVLALGAPLASITTLNPKATEVPVARQNLEKFANVTILQVHSWEYLKFYQGPVLDFVFVDGDHERVDLDFPWFNRLRVGGLILFHDYSPGESKRPCEPVFNKVNWFAKTLGRHPDVLIVDSQNVGMAGFYRLEGEKWPI
jgi:predicted O-methyltransferase YrrM